MNSPKKFSRFLHPQEQRTFRFFGSAFSSRFFGVWFMVCESVKSEIKPPN